MIKGYHHLYGRYVLGNLATNILGGMQYTLATDTMLQSVETIQGSDTSGISAGMNYIGKDIIGQTASLWFMQKIGKYSDRSPQKFFNGILSLQQAAILAETMTFLMPGNLAFLGLAGTANVAKNISFCGIGAINTKVIAKIAESDTRQNGEVYTHLTTIASLGSSLGMATGIFAIYMLPDPGIRMGLVPVIGAVKYSIMRWSLKGLYL